jgi:RpiR family transcriptional regulator, carbohydrate utilization regulator
MAARRPDEMVSTSPEQALPRPGAAAEKARAALPAMPAGEARVVQYLLEQGSAIIHLSVSEVAREAEAGVGTVVRACQTLGYKGFQAAKIALAQDQLRLAERPREDVVAGDTPVEVLAKLAASSGAALARTPASVDPGQLQRAVDLLSGARQVLLLGVGTSAPLAQDAAYRLLTIGIDAHAPTDVHTQHVHARLLHPDDVVLAVSHTGSTHETVAGASGARAAGARVIAVTSFSTSPLTELADAVLVAGSRETAFRVEAMTSRLAHLVVLDALFVSLVLADSTRATASQQLTADVLAEHRF